MQRQRAFPWLPATAVLAFGIAAAVLAPVWPVATALRSPDSSPFYSNAWKASFFNGLIDHRAAPFSHDSLLALALPPLVYHDLSYMVCAALMALAVAVYLRGLRLPPLACLAGGLSMAFSGYHFTLLNAGHRGYLIMMPYMVFLLAAIDRAVRTRRVGPFALMAVCLVYGISFQPDISALLFATAALYALLRAAQALRDAAAEERRRTLRGWGLGLAAGAVTLSIAGGGTLGPLLSSALAVRERQLAQSSTAVAPAPDAPSAPTAEDRAARRRDAWLFATNWSLPFEATLEFVAPSVRGYDSYNPAGPYWGTLGQSFNWAPGRQGFVNFRQHSLYLGVLQLLLAFFAIGSACRRPAAALGADTATPPHARLRGVVAFWSAVALVSLVLAFGRHTPLYRLAYALPVLSHLRAPVKFLHLTELALAILSAVGLAALLAQVRDRRLGLKPVAVATLLVASAGALACLCAALLAPMEGGALAERLAAMNLSAHEDGLRAQYVAALLRGAGLFALGAALFAGTAFLPSAPGPRLLQGAALLLVGVMILDLATAARPYVNPVDLRAHLARNPVADALLAAGGPDGMAVGNRLAPLQSKDPLLWSFSREGFALSDPPIDASPESRIVETLRHFGKDVRRQWLFWGTRAVLVPPAEVARFDADREFAAIGTFAYAGGHLFPAPPEQAQVGAVAFQSWIPPAALYTRWRSVPSDAVWEALSDPDLDLLREAVITDGPACPPDAPSNTVRTARMVLSPSRANWRRAVVEVETQQPGLLVLRELFGGVPRVRATVNGQPRDILQANRFFLAVPVGTGVSRVEFRPALAWWRLGLHGAGLLIALLALWREARAPAV